MTDEQLRGLPLAGTRVLDLAEGEHAIVARMLGDLGADVIRLAADSPADTLAGEVQHLVRHANKRSADPAALTSGERADLVRSADIVLTGMTAADGPWSPGALHEVNPALVVGVVTDFGLDGPARDWVLTDHVLQALSGVLANAGRPGGPPVLAPTGVTTRTACGQIAWSVLVAYYHRLRTGRGDVVDVSVFESALHAMDPAFGIAGSAAGGMPLAAGPRGRPDVAFRYPILACEDGHVRICILAPRQWLAMFAWLGSPEEFADPRYLDRYARFTAVDRLDPLMEELFADKTREELTEEGQRRGIPIQGLLSLDEVMASEHLRSRGVFTDVDLPSGGRVRLAAGAVNLGGTRAGLRRTAPRHGEHTDEIRAELKRTPSRAPSPVREGDAPTRPFEGLRVLDLGVIVLGAEVGRLFADFGADVIKIENERYPDATRVTATGTMGAPFAWGHRGKRALALDLRSEEGVELFHALVREADVVLSNFKPGTMESLGLGHEALRALNPDLVYLESSAFGSTGPARNRMGYGPLVRSASGLTRLWAAADEPEDFADRATVYPDHAAARVCAVAVLANLVARERGLAVAAAEVSHNEVILTHLADVLALESQGGGDGVRAARLDGADAPSGLFPAAGDDDWCVVSVGNADQFRAWCSAIGRPDVMTDPGLATAEMRCERRAELDELTREWVAARPAVEVMTILQDLRVPAGVMLRHSELPDFPQLIERGYYGWLHQPQAGPEPIRTELGVARYRAIPPIEPRPAPELGQHSREIAREVLGLTAERVDDLVARGVLQVPKG